ncbi:hypothetical protein CEQ90_04385 [Lewinellaceae bacterium SD302]|nr:hypothetical protein CEQ90_04385 [Lewinellaceae bacterium SD302]
MIDFEQINDHYYLSGDTTINGSYGQNFYYTNGIDVDSDTVLIGSYTCDGDYVLYHQVTSPPASSLVRPQNWFDDNQVLNFNAAVGDTILYTNNDVGGDVFIVVENVDTVTLLDGIPRRRLDVRDYQPFGQQTISELPSPLYLVEGVGNIRSGLHLHFRNTFNDWNFRQLICYRENGELVYINDDYEDLGCDAEQLVVIDTTYVPLLNEVQKRWNLMRLNFVDGDTTSAVLYNYQDTLIENVEFTKFYVNSLAYDGSDEWYANGEYVGAFREEGREVFFKHPDNPNQPLNRPVLDFNAEIGDTIYRYTDENNVFWFGIVYHRVERYFDDNLARTRYFHVVHSLDLDDPLAEPLALYAEWVFEGVLFVHPRGIAGSLFQKLFNRPSVEHVQCYFEDNTKIFHTEYAISDHLPCFYEGITTSTGGPVAMEGLPAIAFPNPTTGQLQLTTDPDRRLLSAELIATATGRRSPLQVPDEAIVQTTLQLGGHPAGHYVLLLRYRDGRVERISIVKE